MDSKVNDEKNLLRQITYLTRLIQQRNTECATSLSSSSNEKTKAIKQLRNSSYSYHTANNRVTVDTNQLKTTSNVHWRPSAASEKDSVYKAYCRVKPQCKKNINDSTSTKASTVNQLQNSTNCAQKISGVTRNENVNSFAAYSNKMYAHIDSKILVGKELESSDRVEQFIAKRNVHVNPKNRNNIYINTAKLLVAKTINESDRALNYVNSKLPPSKPSIYINPNYNLKRNSEVFGKMSDEVKSKNTVCASVSNINDGLPRLNDVTKSVIQENKNVVTRIHVNKNFIAKNSSLSSAVNHPNAVSMSCAPNLKEIFVENIDSLLNDELSKGMQKNVSSVGSQPLGNVVLTKRKSSIIMPGDLDQDSFALFPRNNKGVKLSRDQRYVIDTVTHHPSGLNKSNSKDTVIKNNKMTQSTLKRNKVLKAVNLDKLKLIRKEEEFPVNTLDVTDDSLQKQKNINKSKNSLSNRFSLNSSLDNQSNLNSSRRTVIFNKLPESLCVTQNFNKPTDLIKVSSTKLIRKRARSVVGVEKACEKMGNTVCQIDWMSPAKKSKSETVSVTSNMKPISQNLKELKKCTDVSKGGVVNHVLNANNSRYKYNAKSTVVSKISQNKLSLVNCLVQSPKRLVSPGRLMNKARNSLNLASSKSRYSVQKQRLKKNSQGSCLISLSPTKLVRSKTSKTMAVIKTNHKIIRNKQFRRNSANVSTLKPAVVNKLSAITRTAKSVKTKYKLIRNSSTNSSKLSWSNGSVSTNRKMCYLRNPVSKRIPNTSKQGFRKQSITIGGIRYRTTRTKLRRTSQDKGKAAGIKIFKNRGDSYRVSSGGRSLKRISPLASRQKQINRAGNSRYVLNKTVQRTHLPHYKVSQAKQRSIALLSRKLRKSNEPCLIFHRFGKCSGKEKGTCIKLHDKKNVAICKRFLKGVCENSDCLLSHDVGPSKMPTCKHYLAGICVRDKCPYLHVKLNSSAPICIAFLQGFCPNAEKCKKRHIDVCPEFEEKGLCSKGKSCLYPHPKSQKSKQEATYKTQHATSSKNVTQGKKLMKEGRELNEDEVSRLEIDAVPGRYYDVSESSRGDDESSHSKSEIENSKGVDGQSTSWFGQRPKIGLLPAYIPLNFDE